MGLANIDSRSRVGTHGCRHHCGELRWRAQIDGHGVLGHGSDLGDDLVRQRSADQVLRGGQDASTTFVRSRSSMTSRGLARRRRRGPLRAPTGSGPRRGNRGWHRGPPRRLVAWLSRGRFCCSRPWSSIGNSRSAAARHHFRTLALSAHWTQVPFPVEDPRSTPPTTAHQLNSKGCWLSVRCVPGSTGVWEVGDARRRRRRQGRSVCGWRYVTACAAARRRLVR